jgi:hypothetical protein
MPASFDRAPCFCKLAFPVFEAGATFAHLFGYGFDLCSGVRGIAPQACTIDAVLFGLVTLTPYGAFSGVGLDIEASGFERTPSASGAMWLS